MGSPRRSKITLLAHEPGANLMRARSIAAILLRQHDVEVVTALAPGQAMVDEIFADLPITRRELPVARYPRFVGSARALHRVATGDLLYAMKPRPTSYGVALLERLGGDRPILLDIDDWEPYMCYPYSKYWLKNTALSLPQLRDPNAFPHTWLLERFVRLAQEVTVVSRFFQRRYGGALLPNGCDTERFDPARYDREALRRECGLADETVIMFVGTADPYKGAGKIVAALDLLARRDLKLVIVGRHSPYVDALARRDDVEYWGLHSPLRSPEFLSMADLVVLPQADLPHAAGQMPMKLFEALSMGLPVISTPLADIPEVLDGCGVIAPSDDPAFLAEQIAALVDAPERRRELGRAARARCVERYSWDVMEGVLTPMLDRYTTRRSAESAGRGHSTNGERAA